MLGFFFFFFFEWWGGVYLNVFSQRNKQFKKSIIMFERSEGEPDLLSLLWALFSSFRIYVSVILSSHEVREYKE